MTNWIVKLEIIFMQMHSLRIIHHFGTCLYETIFLYSSETRETDRDSTSFAWTQQAGVDCPKFQPSY